MADILIRGMKMPNDENGFVKLMILNDGRCFVAVGENEVTSKTGRVTASELPEGHGDLIDRDALTDTFTRSAIAGQLKPWSTIKTAPAIVPADGGTDNVPKTD